MHIAICEIYNKNIHGKTNQSSLGIDSHILVNTTFTNDEFMNNDWVPILDMMRQSYQGYSPNIKQHERVRNYQRIVDDQRYYKLDIVQTQMLEGGECVAVIKTGLLKKFQRRWRSKR
jgi:hypothetical protein